MAYDEELADRVREQVAAREEAFDERRMFGGLAFMVHGHMAVAVSGSGGLMVRIDPGDADALVAADGVERMEMAGRSMKGWLLVDADVLAADDELGAWVERGLAFVRGLSD